MRKLFAPLILSLFFFIPKVAFANTYIYNFPTSVYDIFEADGFYDFFHSVVDNSSGSVIRYTSNVYRYNNTSFSNGTFACTNANPPVCAYSVSGSVTWQVFTFSPFTVTTTMSSNRNIMVGIDQFNSLSLFVYSSLPLTLKSDVTNIYTYTVGNDIITCDPNNGCTELPTLLDLYKLSHRDPTLPPEPEPSDNTPLLTTFYTVVIDKIGEICTFFTSNYLYLSVFVIFLFYISILLLRRFIK